jgi:hypothetical protein
MTDLVFKKPLPQSDDLLRNQMRTVSQVLAERLKEEIAANAHNMDSGLPLEDAFRHELGQLLHPYVLDSGHVVDKDGYTCGDCDVVVADQRRGPLLKRPSSPGSRRKHLPFESVYGIVEVKQTLTLGNFDTTKRHLQLKGSLWDACCKAFALKQLKRDRPKGASWESDRPITILLFYRSELDLQIDANADRLMMEFCLVNSLVPPEERINALFVLNSTSLGWWRRPSPDADPHLHYRVAHPADNPSDARVGMARSGPDTLYELFDFLWTTLSCTQLPLPNFSSDYGVENIRTRLRVMDVAPPQVTVQMNPNEPAAK